METLEIKMDFCSQRYPSLYIFVMKKRNMDSAIKIYMEVCQKLENNFEKYSIYVHSYFLPWLAQEREAGNLKEGRLIVCA